MRPHSHACSTNARIQVVGKLIGTDEDGNTYESLPASFVTYMVCPDYEQQHTTAKTGNSFRTQTTSSGFSSALGTIERIYGIPQVAQRSGNHWPASGCVGTTEIVEDNRLHSEKRPVAGGMIRFLSDRSRHQNPTSCHWSNLRPISGNTPTFRKPSRSPCPTLPALGKVTPAISE